MENELREGSRTVLVYNSKPQLRPGVPEDRRRCCYIYPLYTPSGVEVLDDFPADHFHHRGLFWAWPVVEIGGKKYDGWMMHGLTVRAEKTGQRSGSSVATLSATNAGTPATPKSSLRLSPWSLIPPPAADRTSRSRSHSKPPMRP